MNKFSVQGVVKKGSQKARKIFNIKTANIYLPTEYSPGIYVGESELKDNSYRSLIYIAPPLSSKQKIEVYLFNYDNDDFYGDTLVVHIQDILRQYRPFKDNEDAIQTVTNDISIANDYFYRSN